MTEVGPPLYLRTDCSTAIAHAVVWKLIGWTIVYWIEVGIAAERSVSKDFDWTALISCWNAQILDSLL